MRLLDDGQDGGCGGTGPVYGDRCADCDGQGGDHLHYSPEFGGRCATPGCDCPYTAVSVTIPLGGGVQ
jgi:hypothetical protein